MPNYCQPRFFEKVGTCFFESGLGTTMALGVLAVGAAGQPTSGCVHDAELFHRQSEHFGDLGRALHRSIAAERSSFVSGADEVFVSSFA